MVAIVGSTGQPTASDMYCSSESPTVARPASLAPTSMPTYHCVSNGRGQAPAGTPCAFPFKWKGQLHTKCIGSGYGGQGFCFTAAGKRAGCDCDCDTDEDGLCIDPSLGTDAPTNSPTMTGETASPTTSPTDNPTTQPGLTTDSPTSSEEEAPVFMLGPVVTNTTTSSITLEFGLDMPAMVYTYAVVAGSDAPTGTEIYKTRNSKDVDAVIAATWVSQPSEPFTAVLDGVETGMPYDVYFYARTRNGVGFTDEDVWGNALYGVRTLTVRPYSLTHKTIQDGIYYN